MCASHDFMRQWRIKVKISATEPERCQNLKLNHFFPKLSIFIHSFSSITWDTAVIIIIRKKKTLDFSGFQIMTLSCNKYRSLLVKGKKGIVNHRIHLGKMHVFVKMIL